MRWMSLGLTEEGDHWSKEIRNAARRIRNPKVQQAFTLGLSWLSPDYPLWLMSKEAMLKACRAIASDQGWTEAILDERLRDTRLRGQRLCLIKDVDLDENGRIHGYVLARKPNLKECTFSFYDDVSERYFSSKIGRARIEE